MRDVGSCIAWFSRDERPEAILVGLRLGLRSACSVWTSNVVEHTSRAHGCQGGYVKPKEKQIGMINCCSSLNGIEKKLFSRDV
jgi:hypothetical protein